MALCKKSMEVLNLSWGVANDPFSDSLDGNPETVLGRDTVAKQFVEQVLSADAEGLFKAS